MEAAVWDAKGLADTLLAYLKEHFDDVDITEVSSIEHGGDHCTSFVMMADGERYRFNIADEAVAGLDQGAVATLLANNRVVSVMRDLQGFPVTLTASGCIFGDIF